MNSLPPIFDADFYTQGNADCHQMAMEEAQLHFEDIGKKEGRPGSALALRKNFIEFFKNINSESILEIGPGANPVFSGDNVYYYDVLDPAGLSAKFEACGVNTQNVPKHVHYASKDADMGCIDRTFDLIFSSHCIEHNVDVIDHINTICRLLNSGGYYALIIPDKRFCFDHYKPVTTICDVLVAHSEKRKKHSLLSFLYQTSFSTHNNPVLHWAGNHGAQPSVDFKSIISNFYSQSGYVDSHAHFFTPDTFNNIFSELYKQKIITLDPIRVYNTIENTFEFCAVFKKHEVSREEHLQIKKKMYLHIGFHKTGSTAIQSYCAENNIKLREHGIFYTMHNVNNKQSPNAQSLVIALRNNNMKQAERIVTELYEESLRFDVSDKLFYSAEDLCTLHPETLYVLLTKYFDVTVIAFVRDPLEWTFSNWLQLLKHGVYSDFPTFIVESKQIQCQNLQLWIDNFKNIHIYSYDTHKTNLLCPILKTMNKYNLITELPPVTRIVNRSLRASEATLLRTLNKCNRNKFPGVEFSGALGHGFAQTKPHKEGKLRPHPSYAPICVEKHKPFLDIVTRFLPYDEVVKKHIIEEGAVYDIPESVHAEDLEVCFNKLFKFVADDFFFIEKAALWCEHLFADSPHKAQCPEDFVAAVYLAKHVDVMRAGVDPYMHYVMHGITEGRKYK